MGTFKKKDIKKINVDELVDADGGIINGDESHETTSQIKTAPQQDTDSFVATARQSYRYPYGYGGTAYSHGDRRTMESVDEATEKMDKMVEDILSQKISNNGMVNKNNIPDINRNDIPDLEELSTKYNKQNVAANIEQLVRNSSEGLSGEEKAIILNFIIRNINTNDIDNDYKRILKNMI